MMTITAFHGNNYTPKQSKHKGETKETNDYKAGAGDREFWKFERISIASEAFINNDHNCNLIPKGQKL